MEVSTDLAIIIVGAIALSIGALVGWFIGNWVYGCIVVSTLLFAAIGVLIYAFTQVWSLADDWAGIAFMLYLFVILIVWILIVLGWGIALAARRLGK